MSGITDPTEEYFKDGQWGWDGTQWRKLPLLWGYSVRLVGDKSDLGADEGKNVLRSDAIDPGEIWVIQNIALADIDHALSATSVRVLAGIDYTVLTHRGALAADTYECWDGEIVLAEGDKIQGNFYGCTAGDDLWMRWWGYKMKVAE